MKILEKQSYTQEQIERENLEILALGFRVPLHAMGFNEDNKDNSNSKLTGYFSKGSLGFEYEITHETLLKGYSFDWGLYEDKGYSFDWGLYEDNENLAGRDGEVESFELLINYIAEQGAIIRQKIKEQEGRIAA